MGNDAAMQVGLSESILTERLGQSLRALHVRGLDSGWCGEFFHMDHE